MRIKQAPLEQLYWSGIILDAGCSMRNSPVRDALVGLVLLAPVLVAPLLTASMTTATLAASPAERGKLYARAHCARCHAIGRTGASPFEPAPPFRSLHLRYSIADLAEALAEGIDTGHPAMPEFVLGPSEIHDLLSYLKTLE